MTEHTADVNSVAFSRDDAFIATGSDDNTVILWKWSVSDNNWVFHKLLAHNDDVRSVAFSPSGKLLLGVSANGTISVSDGRTGDSVTLLKEDTKGVNSVAYNLQGTAIASGSDDGTVRQLAHTESTDIADAGISLTLPQNLISEVAFGPNSTYFVVTTQFPTLTGVSAADVIYKTCITMIDIPDGTQFFWAPMERESDSGLPGLGLDLAVTIGAAKVGCKVGSVIGAGVGVWFLGVGAAPGAAIGCTIGGVAVPIVYTIGRFAWEDKKEKEEAEKLLGDPVIKLENGGETPGSPKGTYRILVMIQKRVPSIGVGVGLEYQLKSDAKALWFDPTHTVTYQETLGLADGALAAPGAQPMSLSDYPPFQLLPPEVQAYLLRHFGEFMNTAAWQIPEETALLPNYPNPFNPETWIPYQLSKPADVTLTLYDITGRVVRNLDLGHQRAGMYHSRSRAAYWDGRNEVGESVASGVYFYVLKAGDFSATRKMLIRK